MSKINLIFRFRSIHFNSIENVFDSLLPYFNSEKITLPFSSEGFINRVRNIIYVNKLRTDEIHITGHDHYLLWWKNKKTILTIHDIQGLKRMKGVKYYIFKYLWFSLPIRKADIVTTISEFSKKEILETISVDKEIVVVPNPLTLKIQDVEHKFNSNCPRILHLGTKQNKNLLRLIHAIKDIDCELVIVGKLNLEQLKLLTEKSIKYTNYQGLTNLEVIEQYHICDIVSFVSLYEGFGLPIIEAQAARKPVITSNTSSMPEVGGQGAVFVNPLNIDEIKSGIEMLISDKNLRESLVKAGVDNVNRFEPVTIAKSYSKIYDQLFKI